MDNLSKEYIISFFNKNLDFFGDKPEAVRWTYDGQIMHYEAMLDIGDIRGGSILDFGCGKGDFYGFLRNRGIEVNYTGLDINENLISLAKEKYPGIDFRVFDIERDDLKEEFDFIFLCGVFNLKVCGIEEYIRSTLIKLFKHCKKGLAFNALSAHNPRKDFELFYLLPEDILSFAIKNLSPFVSLRHDRIPYDFTIFVYRDRNYKTL
ncbi:MAG: class I SAM-dependent methyltransferase [Thermodesulfovibrionales bacterium]